MTRRRPSIQTAVVSANESSEPKLADSKWLKALEFVAQAAPSTLGLFFLGFGAYALFVRLDSDDFNPDEYACLDAVTKPFGEYVERVGRYSIAITAQYWACNRFFGDIWLGYRLPGAIFGLLTLVVVWRGLRRGFPCASLLIPIALGLLMFHKWHLYFSRWGMATYGQFIFLGAVIYLISLERIVLKSPFKREGALLLAALFAPWVHLGLMVALMVALFCVAVFNWTALFGSTSRRLSSAGRLILPGLVMIGSFALFWMVQADKPWIDVRPSMRPHDFPSSADERSLAGYWEFVRRNTSGLLFEAFDVDWFTPAWWVDLEGAVLDDTVQRLCMWVFPLSILLGLAGILYGRAGRFTAVYTLLLWLAVLAGGSLGVYRYGLLRYALFLLPPAVVLVSAAASRSGDVVAGLAGLAVESLRRRSWRRAVTPAFTVIVIGAAACFAIPEAFAICERHYQLRTSIRGGYDRILGTVWLNPRDILVIDSETRRVAVTRHPDRVERMFILPSPGEHDMIERFEAGFTAALESEDSDHPSVILLRSGARAWEGSGVGRPPMLQPPRYLEMPSLRQGKITLRRYVWNEKASKLPNRLAVGGATVDSKGNLNLSGWVVSPEIVTSVEIFDGNRNLGRAAYPLARPDVLRKIPELGSEYCGFQFRSTALPDLRPGQVLTIRAFSAAGLLSESKVELAGSPESESR